MDPDWRDMSYGEREFALVSADLRGRTWMPSELTLTLSDALAAIEQFASHGVTSIQWETLQGYADGRIGGGFTVDGVSGVYGSAADFSIPEARDALREEDRYLRNAVKSVHEVLFCLMVMG